MKIWFDVLTPKQVLFFQPLIEKLDKNHTVVITSRNYREAIGLLKMRGLYERTTIVGRFGGNKLEKLKNSLSRCQALTKFALKEQPDLCISFVSPEMSRVAFGLGINHYVYCNASHSDKVLRLSLPFVQKLFCPGHIPLSDWTRYGIDSSKITQYKSLDEWVIVNDKFESNFKPRKFSKPVILVRGNETKATYQLREFDMFKMVRQLAKDFKEYQIVVVPRYKEDVQYMKNRLGKSAYVYDRIVDSRKLLEQCELFIGSGGTMTTEAVLRGVPAISMNTAPNRDEEWLVRNLFLRRAETYTALKGWVALFLKGSLKWRTDMCRKRVMNYCKDPHQPVLKLIK